jgi:hypothetical protein
LPAAAAVVAPSSPAPAAAPPSDEPPTVRAQRYADAALRATVLDGRGGLRELGYHANTQGLLDEWVATATGEPDELLRDVLNREMDRLTPAEAVAT